MRARAGRGIPTAQSPEKSLRAAPGVLFVLILEGKLPPPNRTPRSRRFPSHAPRFRVHRSPWATPGHHHPKTRIAIAARVTSGRTQRQRRGAGTAPVRHRRSCPHTQSSAEPQRIPQLRLRAGGHREGRTESRCRGVA